jgi:hypothetical protein
LVRKTNFNPLIQGYFFRAIEASSLLPCSFQPWKREKSPAFHVYIFVILNHSRRQVVHFAVTAHPTMAWVIQQLREAMPFGQQPTYLFMKRLVGAREFGSWIWNGTDLAGNQGESARNPRRHERARPGVTAGIIPGG